MGGPIAKLCWSRHRDRVRGLVLCATANHFIWPEARGVASAVFPGMIVAARMAPEFFRERIVDGMLRGMPPGERREFARQELSAGDPATVMQAARAVIRFSSGDWAASIDVPTAVVITTRDQLVPPHRQHLLATSIRGAKVFEVDRRSSRVRAGGRPVRAGPGRCLRVRQRRGSGVPAGALRVTRVTARGARTARGGIAARPDATAPRPARR